MEINFHETEAFPEIRFAFPLPRVTFPRLKVFIHVTEKWGLMVVASGLGS